MFHSPLPSSLCVHCTPATLHTLLLLTCLHFVPGGQDKNICTIMFVESHNTYQNPAVPRLLPLYKVVLFCVSVLYNRPHTACVCQIANIQIFQILDPQIYSARHCVSDGDGLGGFSPYRRWTEGSYRGTTLRYRGTRYLLLQRHVLLRSPIWSCRCRYVLSGGIREAKAAKIHRKRGDVSAEERAKNITDLQRFQSWLEQQYSDNRLTTT